MEIAQPLKQYREEFKPQFIEAAKRMFHELAAKANVDVKANHATCSKIVSHTRLLESEDSKKALLWMAFVVMCLASIALFCISFFSDLDPLWRIVLGFSGLGILCFLPFRVYPAISASRRRKKELGSEIEALKTEARKQMSPLNDLYNNDIFPNLFSEVIQSVTFNPYMSAADYRELKGTYGFYENDIHRSLVSLRSGRLNGNLFAIRRYMDFVMGSRTYNGSKTVTVQAREYRDGKYVTVTKEETLYASVRKPYPEFPIKTDLIYANMAAPDLTFHRSKNKFKNKEGSIAYAYNKMALKKKSRNMKKDFAMMTNEEFEILFTTTDRNDNQQYALLFTPVAQANMIDLIRDESIGYGDDFEFQKKKRINTIVSDHLQSVDLGWASYHYKTYNYDEAERKFCQVNLQLFKSIYFGFAPLLCVPLYQQMPPASDVDTTRTSPSCKWEHEIYANDMGSSYFADPSCVTDCILKTEVLSGNEIGVTAYGFRSVPRVDYVTVYSSDNRSHKVPVEWDEYIPVEGSGTFEMPF